MSFACSPYFVRFARITAGLDLAALQTKRTAEAAETLESMSADEVGEIGQFLSTLLVLQGTADIDSSDKAILVPKLKQWIRAFPGQLASDVSERCLALLTDDRYVIYLRYTGLELINDTEACDL